MAPRFIAVSLVGAAAIVFSIGSPVPVKGAAPAANAPATRNTTMFMWDLSDLYPSADAWAAQYEAAKADAQRLERYKGTLGTNPGAMLAAFDAMSAVVPQGQLAPTSASVKAAADLE